MIFGIGTDICDVRRIAAAQTRHGDRFAQRVLGPAELQVWRARGQRWPERAVRYLATRFSAKEAFSKAVGLGLRMPMTWRHCEILNHASGAPYVLVHGSLHDWCAARDLRFHVSVSDESDYASSFCMAEVRPPGSADA
jgi:holo-[acyl-carrier-protein] synthase